ncbi:hypothetical protein EHP00_2705 [Ecytonucleospora hepatopenaei]|uniref:Signal peptidase complex subunit 1 n=1 Tax=Ecytonucleospora hepatopenaei TaxID=646526 RepID=A0A1W0E7S4_9MICR|nr:SPCS1 [Ecytonucleospora hepatopenaei]OQS55314.1 hypothetical protein EHP00_2705 [Ecytonucleospora hepatopenaei]
MKDILKRLLNYIDPVIDYQGQHLNFLLMHGIFICGFLIAFTTGIILNDLKYTLYVAIVVIILNAFITLPGWGFYRRNPMKFKKAKKDSKKEELLNKNK